MSLRCSVGTLGGVPTAFINGEPGLSIGYKSGPQDVETYKDFVRAGYETAHCNVKIDDIWLGPGELDFESLHRSLDTILEADPESFVLLELHANAPEWWVREHPEEQQTDRSGQTYGQSLASQVWRRETLEVISACVRESEEHYGNHVVLYFVGAGHTWEWFYRTPLRYVSDCSQPMVRAFAAWLQRKYLTDGRLSEAWGRDVSIGRVAIPEWSDIIAGDLGAIRDPRVRRHVFDFFEFYNELVADLVIACGTVVKDACGGRKLFGAYYGHVLDWLDNPLTAQHSGHCCLTKVLRSDVVDVVAGPNSYMNRDVGHEASFVAPVDSVRLHGKLWLSETDTRTHLADPIQDFCGRPDSLEDSLTLLKRDFCHALVSGVDMVWFSLFGGWFDDPAIMAFMSQARRIATIARQTDRSSVARIAVLIDERSAFASSGRDAYRVDPFISREPRATDMLAYMGCPYDIYLLSDIDLIDVDRYRMILFVNTIWLDANARAIVDEKLKQDGRVLVWLGTPGVVRSGVGADNMSALIGMRVRLTCEPSEDFIRVLSGSHVITRNLNLGNRQPTWVDADFGGHFGTNQIVSPRACVVDENATPLGLHSRCGSVGFAVREYDSWSSVFIGAPFAPPAILRQIAGWAGVHVYNQSNSGQVDGRDELQRAGWNPDEPANPADDVLYVNDSFLALHVKRKGDRRIVLPEPRKVTDVFADKTIGERTDTIRLSCPGSATYLFHIGETPWKGLG